MNKRSSKAEGHTFADVNNIEQEQKNLPPQRSDTDQKTTGNFPPTEPNKREKEELKFRWRHPSRGLLYSGLILLAVVIAGGLLLLLNASPSRHDNAYHSIIIQEGESFTQIANKLKDNNIVRSALLIRVIARISGEEHLVQSGTFHVPVNLNSRNVLAYITDSNQVLERVTIPEGYTIRKIGILLEDLGISTQEEFQQAATNSDILKHYEIPADSVEGYLYPDTYLFPHSYNAYKIVEQMIDRFYTVLDELYPSYRTLSSQALYNKIIVASIVEREYVDPEEAALISSVFHNRLRIGMALQSCATVVYVLTEELQLPHPQQLFYHDLEKPSAYNTYLHNTLPPTPIANPGRIALQATFKPAESDYIYFVLKGADSTRHHFSRTIEEHSQATIFYLRRE